MATASERELLKQQLMGQDLSAIEAEVRKRRTIEAQSRFLPFVRAVWPQFIYGRHHAIMAEVFERIERGELKRAIINLAPRSTKSRFTSVFFPAWYLGRHPDKKVLECSHTQSLALDFGRDLRNLIATEEYKTVFPGLKLSRDARAAWRWNTNQGGQYFAIGKSGAVAGRGADLCIIDDPHSEQSVVENSKLDFEKTWKWYLAGPRQRLQPGAAILICMTRWGSLDLTGQLERDPDGDEWELIQLPAIMPSGEPLFPEFWPLEELERTRATMPLQRWMANYQQQPTAEEGALIKREWWMNWPDSAPPSCRFVVQAWDTAHSEKENANRSACITWGVFTKKLEDKIINGVVLLDAWVRRVDFPTLKEWARRLYDQWKPDSLVVELASAGRPLVQELWRIGIPVAEANPHRTRDKITRTNGVADMFRSGMIWAPLHCRWAQEVQEEMAAFPNGEYDDLHDAAVWGLSRIRDGNFVRLASDETEEDWVPHTPRAYY
jgi:predicted phage terminase large subunit-like protein